MRNFIVVYFNGYERIIAAKTLAEAEEEASIYAAESGMDRELDYDGFDVSDPFDDATNGTFKQHKDYEYFAKGFEEGWFRLQRVVAAACRSECKNIVLVSARHWDLAMNKLAKYLADPETFFPIDEQGFIDQYGNFLSRKEAYIIAEREGQIIRDCNEHGVLYSENIY